MKAGALVSRAVKIELVLAYPAVHGETGVQSFMVSKEGIVFEKNLGCHTCHKAKEMSVFDPDASWHPVTRW